MEITQNDSIRFMFQCQIFIMNLDLLTSSELAPTSATEKSNDNLVYKHKYTVVKKMHITIPYSLK